MSRMHIEVDNSTPSTSSNDLKTSYDKTRYAVNWGQMMRFAAPTLGLSAALSGLIALTLGAGCADKKTALDAANSGPTVTAAAPTADAPQSSVLEVSRPPDSPMQPSAIRLIPPPDSTQTNIPRSEPLSSDPVLSQPATLAASTTAASASAASASPYTVQRGDTLFRIAREHYGDGKQWTRIVNANPGLTPARLKAGQTIVLP